MQDLNSHRCQMYVYYMYIFPIVHCALDLGTCPAITILTGPLEF